MIRKNYFKLRVFMWAFDIIFINSKKEKQESVRLKSPIFISS